MDVAVYSGLILKSTPLNWHYADVDDCYERKHVGSGVFKNEFQILTHPYQIPFKPCQILNGIK